MDMKTIRASLKTPCVSAFTFPEGPKGRGISEIIHEENKLKIIYDDETTQFVVMTNWWFGTRREYNNLLPEEKKAYELYFIEEGT